MTLNNFNDLYIFKVTLDDPFIKNENNKPISSIYLPFNTINKFDTFIKKVEYCKDLKKYRQLLKNLDNYSIFEEDKTTLIEDDDDLNQCISEYFEESGDIINLIIQFNKDIINELPTNPNKLTPTPRPITRGSTINTIISTPNLNPNPKSTPNPNPPIQIKLQPLLWKCELHSNGFTIRWIVHNNDMKYFDKLIFVIKINKIVITVSNCLFYEFKDNINLNGNYKYNVSIFVKHKNPNIIQSITKRCVLENNLDSPLPIFKLKPLLLICDPKEVNGNGFIIRWKLHSDDKQYFDKLKFVISVYNYTNDRHKNKNEKVVPFVKTVSNCLFYEFSDKINVNGYYRYNVTIFAKHEYPNIVQSNIVKERVRSTIPKNHNNVNQNLNVVKTENIENKNEFGGLKVNNETNNNTKCLILDKSAMDINNIEYRIVKDKFNEKLLNDAEHYEIVEIERISNENMENQYQLLKLKIDNDLGLSKQNEEKYLFQPIIDESMNNIIKNGFEVSKNNNKIYPFYETSRDCLNQCESDSSKIQRMFYCKVNIGEYCQFGNNHENKKSNGKLYETIVDNKVNPMIFGITMDHQAVPCFIINFKRK